MLTLRIQSTVLKFKDHLEFNDMTIIIFDKLIHYTVSHLYSL